MSLVCLNASGNTQQATHGSRRFGMNILDEDKRIVAGRFASSHGPKLEGLDVERADGRVPMLADSLTHCECQVWRTCWRAPGVPRGCDVTYLRGKFGRLEVEQERVV